MSSRGETLPVAPAPVAAKKMLQKPRNGDKAFYVVTNIVGVALRCIVNPQWPCEALLGATAEIYRVAFPDSEVPECNVVFHRKKQEFLVAGTPISECCKCGDELELGVTLPAKTTANVETEGVTSEFSVLFHKLPLGFTMKRGHDGSTEVGTIYPKSVATHFPRLAPGVTIVSIAGTLLKDMGLRQVHELIKNAELPLQIYFHGPELVVTPLVTPESTQHQVSTAPSTETPLPRRRRGSFDRKSVRSNGSNGSKSSRNSRSSGRGKKKTADVLQDGEHRHKSDVIRERSQSAPLADENQSNQHSGPEDQEVEHSAEATLVAHINQLKVALLRKHEEAKQIARQLEMFTEKLVAMRGDSQSTLHQQQQKQPMKQKGAPRSHRSGAPLSSSGSKVRLTPEVLEAMDQKAGLPRRGSGAYTSSNVSSVSGYSAHSTSGPRSGARSARAAALANADNVSVSSYTSNSSNTSARHGGTLRNKRYNYMPQKYATSTTGALEAGATSLSSRGAVMSRARISRDSFITKTESPGVGYYDVKVKDRVKGGEIGDSDRSLAWS